MSVEYYLNCRKNYKRVLSDLDEMIRCYSNIANLIDDDESDYICYNLNFFINKHKHVTRLLDICEKRIKMMCRHDYVTDLVDIDPDTSKSITYCSICEHTK